MVIPLDPYVQCRQYQYSFFLIHSVIPERSTSCEHIYIFQCLVNHKLVSKQYQWHNKLNHYQDECITPEYTIEFQIYLVLVWASTHDDISTLISCFQLTLSFQRSNVSSTEITLLNVKSCCNLATWYLWIGLILTRQ